MSGPRGPGGRFAIIRASAPLRTRSSSSGVMSASVLSPNSAGFSSGVAYSLSFANVPCRSGSPHGVRGAVKRCAPAGSDATSVSSKLEHRKIEWCFVPCRLALRKSLIAVPPRESSLRARCSRPPRASNPGGSAVSASDGRFSTRTLDHRSFGLVGLGCRGRRPFPGKLGTNGCAFGRVAAYNDDPPAPCRASLRRARVRGPKSGASSHG